MSEEKKYRVFKVKSANSDKYYIDYTKNNGYMCMRLHNMISSYKKLGNNPEKFKAYYYIISLDDVMIEEIGIFDTYEEVREFITKYRDDNEGCINGVERYDYVYKEDIKCKKDKVDTKKYLREYYLSNKEKYKERYIKNKEKILSDMRDKYRKNKKNID